MRLFTPAGLVTQLDQAQKAYHLDHYWTNRPLRRSKSGLYCEPRGLTLRAGVGPLCSLITKQKL